jgi:endonuclease/exonuclease/phosphatase family metal-dependent hydrolase
MAVFYRTARFEPLEYDHFWLSDTPDTIGSSTWGNVNRRMVTWIKFRDRQTDRQFYFWNTHFDHAIQEAREKAAELVLRRIRDLKTDLPIILAGDFNAPHRANKTYDLLTAPGTFTDAWFAAEKRTGQNFASFHGYEPPAPDGPHIDWILTRGPVTSREAHLATFSKDGQYPSDHFPVVCTLELSG